MENSRPSVSTRAGHGLSNGHIQLLPARVAPGSSLIGSRLQSANGRSGGHDDRAGLNPVVNGLARAAGFRCQSLAKKKVEKKHKKGVVEEVSLDVAWLGR